MHPGQNLAAPRAIRWQAFSIFVFMLTALLLVACLGRSKDPTSGLTLGHPTTLSAGPAVLSCSTDCRDTAQCGQLENGTQVVLLNSFGPATETHNMAAPVDTTVEIVDVRDEPMRRTSTNDQFSLKYYSVAIEGRLEPGWVAGWCVMGTPAQ